MSESYQEVYEEFKRQRPTMLKYVESWKPGYDDFTIIINYKDGSKDIYDSVLKTTRYIPNDFKQEEQMYDVVKWRREFGIRLHRTICVKGIPQWKLSEISGISEGTISNYINGITTPDAYNVYLLAKALGVSESTLICFDIQID